MGPCASSGGWPGWGSGRCWPRWPRKLSVSCGTCVRFSAPFQTGWADEDLEAVYAQEGTDYRLLFRNEEE